MKKIISRILMFLGFFCFIIAFCFLIQRYNPYRLSFSVPPTNSKISQVKEKNLAVFLSIKNLGINNLPIYPSRINGREWETTDKGVSYLTTTPPPGEKGNSILYGHNWSNLLGSLLKAVPGQNIEITFSDKTKKEFVIERIAQVSPNEKNILSPSNDNRITLYTCSGFLDSKRFVVVANLKNL
jgi:LPXTG-site transpeptidase (sortase) family protein